MIYHKFQFGLMNGFLHDAAPAQNVADMVADLVALANAELQSASDSD